MQYEISKFLVELRLEAGNTQNELGQYLGVSNKTISKWENGVSIPDTFYIPKLAKYYNVSCDELLNGCYKLDSEKNKINLFQYVFCLSTIFINVLFNFMNFFLAIIDYNCYALLALLIICILINLIAVIYAIYKISKEKSLNRLLTTFYLCLSSLCLAEYSGELFLVLN